MSLLYDALKKAQKDQPEKKPQKAPSKRELSSLEKDQKKAVEKIHEKQVTNKRNLSVVRLFKVLFIVGVIGLLIYFYYLYQLVIIKEASLRVEKETLAQENQVIRTQNDTLFGEIRKAHEKVVDAIKERSIAPIRTVKIEREQVSRQRPVSEITNEQFVCTGIIIDPDGSYCFLNGILGRVGEEIDGALIKEIEPRHIVIEFQNELIKVPLQRRFGK